MGNCGSAAPTKTEQRGNDVIIKDEPKTRPRQTTSMAVNAHASSETAAPTVSRSAADERALEHERLRQIVSYTNKNFIDVSSVGIETPPGVEEASQRYKSLLAVASIRIPNTLGALPAASKHIQTQQPSEILASPMDPEGLNQLTTATNNLLTCIEEMQIPINPQDLVIEWSVAASVHTDEHLIRV